MPEAESPDPYSSPASQPPAQPLAAPQETSGTRRAGPWVIALLVIVLLVLHQDYWFWTSDYLVFGWAPIGLFYHACLSVAAALVWLLATRIAWPVETIRQARLAAPAVDEDPQP